MGGGDKQQLDARKDVMMKKEKMTVPRTALEEVREADSYLCSKRHQDGTIQFCAATIAESAEKDLLL